MSRTVIVCFCGIFANHTIAATRTFFATVTPISTTQIEQVSELNFGLINNQIGAQCQINSQGTLQGECISGTNLASTGQLVVSGLFPNQVMNISVQGSSDRFLSFSPNTDLQGATTPLEQIENGQQRSFTTSSEGQNIILTIYGNLELLASLPEDEASTIEYTVTIEIE